MTPALLELPAKCFDFPARGVARHRSRRRIRWDAFEFPRGWFECSKTRRPAATKYRRITPDTAEVAARCPDKYRGHTDQPALTLDRIKYFADTHLLKLAKCRCGIQI
jgi:hypothetical protein